MGKGRWIRAISPFDKVGMTAISGPSIGRAGDRGSIGGGGS